MKTTFINCLMELAEKNQNLLLLTGDIGFGVLAPFQEKFSERFINVGISEQNMASVAAGLALEGKTVYTYSIGNFNTLRSLEQIRNDIAYHNANVKIVSVGGGFSYGAMGMSHHATEDISIMRSLPEMRVFVPCDSIETTAVMRLADSISGPCYIRLGKENEPVFHQNKSDILEINRLQLLRSGSDVAILAAGPVVIEALKAAHMLIDQNISCAVYSCPSIKPLDQVGIQQIAECFSYIFTIEEHNIFGGIGSAVCEVLSVLPRHAPLFRFGLTDEYTSVIGTQCYLREVYGLESKNIYETIIKLKSRSSGARE